jgi:hypothetical protein
MGNGRRMKSIFKNRILQILIHIIAWGLFLSMLSSLVHRPPNMNPLLSNLVPDLFFISFYYINFFFLVPKFFIPKKFLLYGIICVGYLLLTITVPSSISGSSGPEHELRSPPEMEAFPRVQPPPDMHKPDFPEHERKMPPRRIIFFIPEFSYTIFVFLFILTLSTGIRILLEWQQSEREKVKTELAFLKAQINPHFLFNTLNSIYSMAIIKDNKTPYAIEMFSDLMRYVLYETCHDLIPLDKKLQYIDTYIELQRLRLSPVTRVEYGKWGDTGGLTIAPLTLMPFIENAFKYGVSTERETVIDIKIEIKEDQLYLRVMNSITGNQPKDNPPSQLGIENTVRRLNLIYPGKYDLRKEETANVYIVHLKLNLT